MGVDPSYLARAVLRCVAVAVTMGLVVGFSGYLHSKSASVGILLGLWSAGLFLMNGDVVPLPKD